MEYSIGSVGSTTDLLEVVVGMAGQLAEAPRLLAEAPRLLAGSRMRGRTTRPSQAESTSRNCEADRTHRRRSACVRFAGNAGPTHLASMGQLVLRPLAVPFEVSG
eukprot:6214395-Pleurochrysis_carterae.AAC.3